MLSIHNTTIVIFLVEHLHDNLVAISRQAVVSHGQGK